MRVKQINSRIDNICVNVTINNIETGKIICEFHPVHGYGRCMCACVKAGGGRIWFFKSILKETGRWLT